MASSTVCNQQSNQLPITRTCIGQISSQNPLTQGSFGYYQGDAPYMAVSVLDGQQGNSQLEYFSGLANSSFVVFKSSVNYTGILTFFSGGLCNSSGIPPPAAPTGWYSSYPTNYASGTAFQLASGITYTLIFFNTIQAAISYLNPAPVPKPLPKGISRNTIIILVVSAVGLFLLVVGLGVVAIVLTRERKKRRIQQNFRETQEMDSIRRKPIQNPRESPFFHEGARNGSPLQQSRRHLFQNMPDTPESTQTHYPPIYRGEFLRRHSVDPDYYRPPLPEQRSADFPFSGEPGDSFPGEPRDSFPQDSFPSHYPSEYRISQSEKISED